MRSIRSAPRASSTAVDCSGSPSRRVQSSDDPRLGQTPQREADRTRRRSVEPLEVVDREHEPVLGEHLERAADGDAEGALVDGLPARILHEQRDFERVPARRCQPRQHLVEDALEEVAEPGIREAAFRLGRP